ncbi:MAG: flagellar biosynthesis protein FliQ [Bdellovibrionales bacterium]
MSEAEVISITREAMWVMLKIAGPLLFVALVVGVAISLIQALTQIQEMTLTFVPKIVVMLAAALLMLPFMMQTLGTFTDGIADRIVAIGQTDETATAP